MRQRINLRLSIIALIAVLATTTAATLVFYGIFKNQVHEDLKQNAKLLIETNVFQNAYSSESDDYYAMLNTFASGSIRITWIDQDGNVLFDNDTNATNLSNHLDRPEIRQAITDGEGESSRHSDTFNLNNFYYAVRLDNGTILRVSTQAGNISNVLLNALPVILAIIVIILLICVFIGYFLTRSLMEPIKTMAENLDGNAAVPTYKELEPFADRIRIQHENILAAARSRQDFTANVTHELKTPIAAISGYAELIENGMVNDRDLVHIASQIRGNAERLTSLISDIIKLSELDHSEITRKFEKTELLSLAKECTEMHQPLAGTLNIRLRCGGEPAYVNGDEGLIRELIDNLLQNAIRYNRANGEVLVTVKTENGRPELTVRDTGIGIPEELKERVFERFYRVDKSRSRETGGTGLGLAIVKHIAEIHDADIEMDSTVGEGTEIRVLF